MISHSHTASESMDNAFPSSLKKILVATDFSECSINAIKYAQGLASKSGAQLILFNSVGVPGTSSDMLVNPLHLLEKIASDRLEAVVEDMKTESKTAGGAELNVSYTVRAGFPSENILQVVGEESVDLLVVGTKGIRKGMGWLLGSTSSEVVRRSKVPVLAVPCDAPSRDLSKIVLAADLQEMSGSTLNPVFTMAQIFDCELEVLHVIPPQEHFSPSTFDSFKSTFMDVCPLDEVSFHLFETEEATVATAIQDYVQFQNADLVVMTSRPRSLLGRLFHPSEAKRLSLETKVPLLVLHEQS